MHSPESPPSETATTGSKPPSIPSDPEKAVLPEDQQAGPGMQDGDEKRSLQREDSRVQRPQSLVKESAFVALLCSAQLMTQAGLGMSIAPIHIIGESFATKRPEQLSWYAAAYSLTVGTFILIAGRLGDVFGHKRFFVAGFAWFALWSMVAGLAVYSGEILFDFARAMQGIGPAFLLPNALAIIARTYEPGPRQNMIFSLFGATAPGGFVLAAVFSSIFAQLVWWPWAFWAMALACLVLAIAGYFIIPVTPQTLSEETSESSIWSKVDALGSVLGVSALVLFNFAWNQGPVVGWTTPYTYITLIIGVLLIACFFFVESRVAHPLLPVKSLSLDVGFALGCIAAGWGSFGVYILYGWNFMEILRGQTPLLTTGVFAPVAISGLLAAIVTGVLISRIHASLIMMIAMTAFVVGGILLVTAPVDQTSWAQTFVAYLILPWGMDMSFPAATILMSRAMPRQHQGLAASLVNTVLNYSISIGLGMAGTVEYNVNDGGANIEKGYRAAWGFAIGLSTLGVGIAATFCLTIWRRSRAK